MLILAVSNVNDIISPFPIFLHLCKAVGKQRSRVRQRAIVGLFYFSGVVHMPARIVVEAFGQEGYGLRFQMLEMFGLQFRQRGVEKKNLVAGLIFQAFQIEIFIIGFVEQSSAA